MVYKMGTVLEVENLLTKRKNIIEVVAYDRKEDLYLALVKATGNTGLIDLNEVNEKGVKTANIKKIDRRNINELRN